MDLIIQQRIFYMQQIYFKYFQQFLFSVYNV